MTNLSRESTTLARSSIVSGSLTLGLALTALAFPEPALIGAMLTVGLLSVLFGLNHILSAVSIRAGSPYWRLVLAHGLVLLMYGLLTAGATALSLTLMLVAIVAWLVGHAALTIRIATKTRDRWTRAPFLAIATVDLGIGLLIIALRPLTIFQFLFFGAAYAAVFGLSQVAAGVALRNTARRTSEERPRALHA